MNPSPACPVADVEAIVLHVADEAGDLDASHETIVVRVTDAEGRAGVGEADAPARVVRELVVMDDLFEWSRGLRSIVIGLDPIELAANHRRMGDGTLYHGRRGLGIHALSAVDLALHDLAGKQLGRPAYQLLGGAVRDTLIPYATIWPGSPDGRSLTELLTETERQFALALDLGFRAVKMEVVYGAVASDDELVRAVLHGRDVLGPDVCLLVDFGYRWHHWRDAARALARLGDADVFLAEAALQHDDVDGTARLGTVAPMRIGGGEFAATVHECRDWIERGQVDVLQPDLNRCGGLTELRRIAELAALHGVEVVPHGWKTGITVAAQRHFQAATANCPLIETCHPALFPSTLRSLLTGSEAPIEAGRLPLPTGPGLGIELDEAIVERHRIA